MVLIVLRYQALITCDHIFGISFVLKVLYLSYFNAFVNIPLNDNCR